jgi:hypothetical protein
MRRLLLAAVALSCLCQQVRAQTIVSDPGSLVQQVKAFVQENKKYLLQLQQLQHEAQTAIQTGQMVAGMIQHPSLGAAMGLMNMAGLGSVLPVSPYAVQGIISGRGNIAGLPNQLSGLINGSFGSNSVYTCTDNSWACQQQQMNSRGLNGSQGIAMNALQTVASHVPILNELRANLAEATTPAERENAMAAIQTEHAWAEQQQVQLTSVALMMQSQRDLRDQRDNEAMSRGIDSWLEQANASGRGLLQ